MIIQFVNIVSQLHMFVRDKCGYAQVNSWLVLMHAQPEATQCICSLCNMCRMYAMHAREISVTLFYNTKQMQETALATNMPKCLVGQAWLQLH